MNDTIAREVDRVRQVIATKIPPGSILPEHDDRGHHYRVHLAPGSPLFDSVTTKSTILGENHLKMWSVSVGIDYIRDNWQRALADDFSREEVFLAAQQAHVGIFDDAGDIGSRIHESIENYLNEWIQTKQRPLSIRQFIPASEGDVRVIAAVLSAEKFCLEQHIVPIYSELLVASPRYRIAGTLDLLAFKGRVLRKGDGTCGHNHDFWGVGKRARSVECSRCGLRIDYALTLVDWKSSNSVDKPAYVMQVSSYWECLKELTGLKPEEIVVVQLNKTRPDYSDRILGKIKRAKAFKSYVHLTQTYDWLKSEDAKFDINKKQLTVT